MTQKDDLKNFKIESKQDPKPIQNQLQPAAYSHCVLAPVNAPH